MITHDLSTAAHFADRIAVMYLGRIVEEGPAKDVVRNPLHPYTKALDLGRAQARPARLDRAADPDGRDAEPRAHPRGLPLPSPLPDREGRLPHHRPRAAPAKAASRRSTASPASWRERWRDIGGPVGLFPTGARNAITDVPGVLVGHAQAASGEATGVTVVAPPDLPARAGTYTVNGVGELTKKLEIDEWGIIQSPVWLCGTHAVGMVYHAAVLAAGGDPDNTVIPVVGECDDSDMGDSRDGRRRRRERRARERGRGRRGGDGGWRHRDDVLRLPRWDRHGVADRRRAHGRRAAHVQLRRSRALHRGRSAVRPGRPAGTARGLVHRRLRDGRAARVAAAAAAVAAPAARPGRAGSYASQRLGRDRARVHGRRGAGVPARAALAAVRGGLRGRRGVGLQLPGRGQAGPGAATGRPQERSPCTWCAGAARMPAWRA